jgi:hypothetical protein
MSDSLPPDPDLAREVQLLRDSGALGRPGPLSRLFEFLSSRTAGPAPKEIEIAVEVFGKRADFDVAQDSVVRVYVHKLRKRLDDYYARHARPGRIVIPKGEYRLVFERTQGAPQSEPIAASPPQFARKRWLPFAGALLAAAALGALGAAFWLRVLAVDEAQRELHSVRASAVWAPLLADERPVTIVVGDYYLLGETDAAGNVARLVREFHINSPADFIDHLELDPERMQRYRNVDLTYLPTGAALAIYRLAPVLEPKRDVRIVLMSDLDGETLANSHIVYIGYLSGLGMLGDVVFDASRLRLGGTYDELVDPATRRTYVARQPASPGAGYTDYGYFAELEGPRKQRIVVIAGTRDLGVMQTAEAVTRADSVAALAADAGGAAAFESLMEVQGVAHASMNTKRLFVAPINGALEAPGD